MVKSFLKLLSVKILVLLIFSILPYFAQADNGQNMASNESRRFAREYFAREYFNGQNRTKEDTEKRIKDAEKRIKDAKENMLKLLYGLFLAIPGFLLWLTNKRKCSFCGKWTSRKNVVCEHCGKTDDHMEGNILGIKRTCPYCHQKTDSKKRLCVHCGRDVYQHWNIRIGDGIERWGCLVLIAIVIVCLLSRGC